MSKPFRLSALAALLVLGVACGLYLQSPVAAQDKEQPKEKVAAGVTKWEYRIVTMESDTKETEKELNKLGEEGFEISFVTGSHKSQARAFGKGGGVASEASPVVYYTLKRAKK
jgi:hypothetical protein